MGRILAPINNNQTLFAPLLYLITRENLVVTPDGVAVTKRVHAAMLVCVKGTGLFNILAYTLTIISLLAVVYLVVQVVN